MGVAVFLVLFCLIMLMIIIKCSSKNNNKYRINNEIIQESSELESAEITSNHLYVTVGESNENNLDSNLALEASETNFGYSMVHTEEPSLVPHKSSELYKELRGSEGNYNGANYINSIIGTETQNKTTDMVPELNEAPLLEDREASDYEIPISKIKSDSSILSGPILTDTDGTSTTSCKAGTQVGQLQDIEVNQDEKHEDDIYDIV